MRSPLVDQFKKGGVSRDVRLTAASGALPLTPADQVELLFLLTRDRDEEIREAAERSLVSLSEDDLVSVLKEAATSMQVLEFFGARVTTADLQQVIVRNATTSDETILEMVPRLDATNLEFLVVNQMRLLRCTALIGAVESNQSLSSDQRRRILELKHDFRIDQPEEVPPPPEAVPEAVGLEDLGQGPPEDEAPPPASVEEAREIYGADDDSDLDPEEVERRESALKRIVGMNPAEKMIEALKGDREARMILIRDRNRVVYSSVLSSPKITDGEVEAIASMRNVSPEVLRSLGGRREWTKRYTIAHELVRNPLTPVEVSMRLIQRLSSRDLKKLTKDRNVAETVRRQATKLTRKDR